MYIKPEPGIYQITDNVTQDKYIGASRNVQARKRQHYYDLRKNKHRNPNIQKLYNLGHTFSISILEYLPSTFTDDMIMRREQEWMDFVRPTLNSHNAIAQYGSDLELQRERKLAGGKGRTQSQEEKNRRAESVREYWKNNPPKKMPLEFVEKLKKRMSGEGHHNWGKSTPKEVKDKIANSLAKFTYIFLSPKGEIVEVTNLRKFISETRLWQMYNLAKGKLEEYNGWRFVRTETRPTSK